MLRRWLGGMLCGVLVACSDAPTTDNKPKGPPPISVSMATASVRTLEQRTAVLAEVESLNAATVVSETAGRVVQLHVDVGSQVQAGQLLATIDAADLTNTRLARDAEALRLQTQAEQQQRQVSRYQQLFEQGFVSSAYLEEQKTQLAALQKQVSAAQAQAENARRDQARAGVKAAQAGTIDSRLVSEGEYVSVGKALFRLVGQQGLRARFALSEREGSVLRVGSPVTLTTETGDRFTAAVSEIRPTLDSQNRMLEALVALSPQAKFRVGQSVEASVVLSSKQALAVPSIAVVARQQGSVVFVADKGQARATVVKTGVEDQGWVEVVDGLAAGTPVVSDGAGFLSDGAKIKAKTEKKDSKDSKNSQEGRQS